MTTRADYTSEEWALLVDAPRMIGLGMMMVSSSGPTGKLRELLALRACLRVQTDPDLARRNQLIAEILAEQPARTRELTEPLSIRGNLIPLLSAIIAARIYMLAHSEMVANLLADRAPYTEAQEVKRWLMWIARRVASASGDRWLGTGQKCSDAETSMLNRLATSLHIVTTIDALPPVELETQPGMQGQPGDGASGGEEGPRRMLHRGANS